MNNIFQKIKPVYMTPRNHLLRFLYSKRAVRVLKRHGRALGLFPFAAYVYNVKISSKILGDQRYPENKKRI